MKRAVVRLVAQRLLFAVLEERRGILRLSQSPLKDRFFDDFYTPIKVFSDLFPPKMEGEPSESPQFSVLELVALNVPGDLGYPVIWIFTLFQFFLEGVPVFSVEELRIAENRYLVFCDGDVRPSGDLFIILTVSDTFMP